MAVTLILTRYPLRSFWYGGRSGRFGELVAVKGPRITRARFTPAGTSGGAGSNGGGSIQVEHGTIELSTDGAAITDVKRFTSMERFMTDNGKSFFVQLHPKPDPYTLTYEHSNSAVAHLRPPGECFRVHGGKPGPEQGILIHEAPQIGWLIGCISPRPLGNFEHHLTPDKGNNLSHMAMQELFDFVGHKAEFFVTDW